MSNLVISGVAAGSTTIRAKQRSTGNTVDIATTVTASSGGGTVTAVTVGPYTEYLMRSTDAPYTLVAYDQNGAVIPNSDGTWASTDSTNLPISSGGVVTPNASMTAIAWATFTFTHTASQQAGSAKATLIKGSTKLNGDDPHRYAGADDAARTAAFRAVVSNNVPGGTCSPSSAFYTDGYHCDYTSIDSTPARLFMGRRTQLFTMQPGTGVNECLRLAIPGGTRTRMFNLKVIRYAPSGESGPSGTAGEVDFGVTDTTGNAAWKANAGWDFAGVNGRMQTGYSDENASLAANYDNYIVANGDNDTEIHASGAKADFTTNAGEWLVQITVGEKLGPNVWQQRLYQAPIGSPLVVIHTGVVAMTGTGYKLWHSSPFGENVNKNWVNLGYRSTALWEDYDGDADPDPLGVFGPQSTPVVSSISPTSLAGGSTNVLLTINGSGFNANCSPNLPSGVKMHNSGENISNLSVTGTAITMHVDVAAGSASGNVSVTNLASGVTSGTAPLTLT